jgi:hypothetical protein
MNAAAWLAIFVDAGLPKGLSRRCKVASADGTAKVAAPSDSGIVSLQLCAVSRIIRAVLKMRWLYLLSRLFEDGISRVELPAGEMRSQTG